MDRYVSISDTMNFVSNMLCIESVVAVVGVAILGALALLHLHARALLRWRLSPARVENRFPGRMRSRRG